MLSNQRVKGPLCHSDRKRTLLSRGKARAANLLSARTATHRAMCQQAITDKTCKAQREQRSRRAQYFRNEARQQRSDRPASDTDRHQPKHAATHCAGHRLNHDSRLVNVISRRLRL